MRRGIILAGGSGTRLHPLTFAITKQLLPVYNKPMIYYPLSVLMLAGVREVLIITTEADQPNFQRLLGDGSFVGLDIQYVVQPKPEGLAQAYILGEDFVQGEPSALVLGDNLFFGAGFSETLHRAAEQTDGATIFGYRVADARAYGVVDFDETGRALSIEEKPQQPRSNTAVTGLYFYDGQASTLARTLKPSRRGELEITDLNRLYLEAGKLTVEVLGRGFAWLDTGAHDSLLEASEFVRTIEHRQDMLIGSIEEIAYTQGWIDRAQLMKLAGKLNNTYGAYLRRLGE
jgi:glucose-1-phosphate thymidylyltransferase